MAWCLRMRSLLCLLMLRRLSLQFAVLRHVVAVALLWECCCCGVESVLISLLCAAPVQTDLVVLVDHVLSSSPDLLHQV